MYITDKMIFSIVKIEIQIWNIYIRLNVINLTKNNRQTIFHFDEFYNEFE